MEVMLKGKRMKVSATLGRALLRMGATVVPAPTPAPTPAPRRAPRVYSAPVASVFAPSPVAEESAAEESAAEEETPRRRYRRRDQVAESK